MISAMFAWLALAGDADVALDRFEVGQAVEGQADTDASSRIRSRTDLSAQVELGDGWDLFAAGALRVDPLDPGDAHAPPSAADLYRFALSYSGPRWTASVGRIRRVNPMGAARLDGILVDSGGDLGVTAWGGRISHVEPVDGPAVIGGGVDLRWRPDSRIATLSGLAGYELRGVAGDGGFATHRVHAAGTAVGPRGGTVDGRLTLGVRTGDDARVGARAELTGEAPVGETRVRASVRWEGLPRDDQPETALGVVTAIAPDGYGVVDVGARWRRGPVELAITGGPSLSVGSADIAPVGGAVARGTAEVRKDAAHLGAFGAAASIGPSWYAGGGLTMGTRRGAFDLSADAGLFRFDGIGGAGVIAEARGWVDVTAGKARLSLFGATGTDRLRSVYLRGGAAVRGVFG